ncbi:MAG: hypothetical protein GY806_07550 [Gammaproteobacteria bacterium]|nr:hypothetical protein [Gammaproteobacteria bacterium]
MQNENVWERTTVAPKEIRDLKTRSDLLTLIEGRLGSMEGDKAERLGINEDRLEDLVFGKIDKFHLTELESIARRAGILKQ